MSVTSLVEEIEKKATAGEEISDAWVLEEITRLLPLPETEKEHLDHAFLFLLLEAQGLELGKVRGMLHDAGWNGERIMFAGQTAGLAGHEILNLIWEL